MATAVEELDLQIGEPIEVAGPRHEVVPYRQGGLIFEPAITPIADLDSTRGTGPASAEDFQPSAADIPHDGEG